MISAENYLNNFDFAKDLGELSALLDKTTAKVTFWGSRIVEIKGQSGCITLEAIVKRALMGCQQRYSANDLTLEERIDGVEAMRKLHHLYRDTDQALKKSNFLTRLFHWIREYYFNPDPARFDRAEDRFLAFNKEEFIENFGDSFNEMGVHPASRGKSSFGQIIAKPERVKALCAVRIKP